MFSADKNAFEGFGILYYPAFRTEAELAQAAQLVADEDMARATTAAANMIGTSYSVAPASVCGLAAYYAHVRTLYPTEALSRALLMDPGVDIRLLVPSIKVSPMYPGFPAQVLQMSEAQFRFDQLCHYASTYGVEDMGRRLGMPVTVMRGWLPEGGGQPTDGQVSRLKSWLANDRNGHSPFDNTKLLDVVLTEERMLDLVKARISRPTRMHPAEVSCAVALLKDVPADQMPNIAFHENMLEFIRVAALGSAQDLRSMMAKTVQHPGDVLKALTYVRNSQPKKRLATRQKKAFCDVLGGFSFASLAGNIADAHPIDRTALNYLSIQRFGNQTLRDAVAAVEGGKVKSWNAQVEQVWARTAEEGFQPLLDKYLERPGVLLRSMTRLAKAGVSADELAAAAERSDAYSLPSIVRTLTMMSGEDMAVDRHWHGHLDIDQTLKTQRIKAQKDAYAVASQALAGMLKRRLTQLDTPLRDKRVFVDAGNFNLQGSLLLPNTTGDTGTAYPPAGMAFNVPAEGCVRFFTFWNDPGKRVDVDLHFFGEDTSGESVHVGWNSDFRQSGMVFSGDITHSDNAAEYLDINMEEARKANVDHVMQQCHIFAGADNWGDIATCFSGALAVDPTDSDASIYQGENLLFRDDMTGEGREMLYAMVDVQNNCVRILRGESLPFRRTRFTLATYVDYLLASQNAQRVKSREEADVVLSVGRTDDDQAICLIDQGFFLK